MVEYQYLDLELIRNTVKRHIPEAVLHQSNIILENMVMEMTTHVAGDKAFQKEVTAYYTEYTSWWQHVKAELFPTFAHWVKRPPKTRRVPITFDVTGWFTFPDADIYPVELGRPVEVVHYERKDRDDI